MKQLASMFRTLIAFVLLSFVIACRAEPANTSSVDTVLIVLGNEPLDDSTPTVDTIARVNKAVEYAKKHPGCVIIMSGGPTAGSNTEARMMRDIAVSQGISSNSIILEETSLSTGQNAFYTAPLVRKMAPRRILIVSKSDHIDWAMPCFKRYSVFEKAEPLACDVDPAASIAQMREYLKTHTNEAVVRRMYYITNSIRGID